MQYAYAMHLCLNEKNSVTTSCKGDLKHHIVLHRLNAEMLQCASAQHVRQTAHDLLIGTPAAAADDDHDSIDIKLRDRRPCRVPVADW